MQCPNCSAQMQLMQRYDADIDYCPSCKGVWLDRGEIDKIANIQNRYEDQHYNKYYYRKEEYDDDYDDGDDDYYNNNRWKKSNRWKKRGFFDDLFDFG